MEKLNREQPKVENEEVINVKEVEQQNAICIGDGNAEVDTNQNLGSDGSLGKFKSVETLFNAYENLEAEFTKKCQKLAEANENLESIKRDSIDNAKQQSSPADDDTRINSSDKKKASEKEETATFEQIINKIFDEKMEQKKSEPTREDLINLAINDTEIRNAVMTHCMQDASTNHIPYLMSRQTGNISLSATHLPKNVKEAGRLAIQLLGEKN